MCGGGSTLASATATSTPEPSGRCRSSSTTSGRVAVATRTACATSPAVPHTTIPAASRSRATPSRQIGWSSTTRTLSGASSAAGHTQLHLRSAAWRRVDARGSADRPHPPDDALVDAEPAVTARCCQPVRRHSGAIVAHADRDPGLVVLQQYPSMCALARVPLDVVERRPGCGGELVRGRARQAHRGRRRRDGHAVAGERFEQGAYVDLAGRVDEWQRRGDQRPQRDLLLARKPAELGGLPAE